VIQENNAQAANKRTNNKKVVLILVVAVIGMFGFGFALVPLYDVFCNITGLNGKTNNQAVSNNAPVDKSRLITVQFIATNNATLPWKFYPLIKKVKVHPGENRRIAYYAENDSGKTMVVQAIPSVSPNDAARYLKKTECFCFNQQTLKSGESMDMPLIFHIDKDIPKNVRTITLSYTLFDAGKFAPAAKSKQGRL